MIAKRSYDPGWGTVLYCAKLHPRLKRNFPSKRSLSCSAFAGIITADWRRCRAVIQRFKGERNAVQFSTRDGYTLLLARVGSQATLPALKPDFGYKWNDSWF